MSESGMAELQEQRICLHRAKTEYGEPITEAWLKAIGGECGGKFWRVRCGNVAIWWNSASGEVSVGATAIPQCKTRQQMAALILAIIGE